MKPIIVTYSNESWIMDMVSSLSISGPDGYYKEIKNSGHYICTHLGSNKVERIIPSDVKLIARPNK